MHYDDLRNFHYLMARTRQNPNPQDLHKLGLLALDYPDRPQVQLATERITQFHFDSEGGSRKLLLPLAIRLSIRLLDSWPQWNHDSNTLNLAMLVGEEDPSRAAAIYRDLIANAQLLVHQQQAADALSVHLKEAGRFQEAEQILLNALKLPASPNTVDDLKNRLIELYSHFNHPAKAFTWIADLLQRHSCDRRAAEAVSRIMEFDDRPPDLVHQVEAFLQKVARRNPESSWHLAAWARFVRLQGDLGRAAHIYELAQTQAPHSAKLAQMRAMTLRHHGQTEAAERVICAYIRVHQPTLAIARELGYLGQWDQAAAASLKALDPKNPISLNHFAWAVARAQDLDHLGAALQAAAQAVSIDRDPAYLHTLARLHELEGDIDKARALYMEATPGFADASVDLAQLELNRGDTSRAYSLIMQLVQNTPDFMTRIEDPERGRLLIQRLAPEFPCVSQLLSSVAV